MSRCQKFVWLIPIFGLLGFSAMSFAQSDRRAIEYYEANFEKYLGKEISVDVASCSREDTGEFANVAIFSIYTRGETESGFTYAVIPKSDVTSFSRKYAEKDVFYRGSRLRGVFLKGGLRNFYISVDGAVLPKESTD